MFAQGYVAAQIGPQPRQHRRPDAATTWRTGELAPMGGDLDLMDPISHHAATRDRSRSRRASRRRLRPMMGARGFAPYEREWWHYTPRRGATSRRPYFDFPIVVDGDR